MKLFNKKAPTPDPHAALKTAALEYVNTVRAEFMLPPLDELPKGRPYKVGDCPIARGIKQGAHYLEVQHAGTSSDVIDTRRGVWGQHFHGSSRISEFVYAFDHRYMPELIA